MTQLNKTPLKVKSITQETASIRTIKLVRADGGELPAPPAGSHIMLHLPNGLVRQYSLTNAQSETDAYRLSILLDEHSRGGSAYLHQQVNVGDELVVSGPKSQFPLVLGAETSLLIGGGIGVTPLLSMAKTLHQQGQNFELHYCARHQRDAAFVKQLRNCEFADRVHFYFSRDPDGERLNFNTLLHDIVAGRHLFCCGPNAMMDAVAQAASHWPRGSVHFEKFKADNHQVYEDIPFQLVLERSNKTFTVPADKSALDVLHDNGYDIDNVCGEGICGACLINVVDGEVEHRDGILSEDEKSANDIMTLCCSRAKSDTLVIEL
ncbi:oxidoreductase [Alteromonas aestuariivivens]|uniref:Oxidoreductase n=1 Tax=Alteromonas aestuariivivens TaxID=1938339 RepID=A0A3D8MEI9_9ALTE|nr:PDR/VanB family oxidoreductase [Alteromonas aestuariivivens]RDV29237.1 oxidoreductase [Alteromonas aestuariivivens]